MRELDSRISVDGSRAHQLDQRLIHRLSADCGARGDGGSASFNAGTDDTPSSDIPDDIPEEEIDLSDVPF